MNIEYVKKKLSSYRNNNLGNVEQEDIKKLLIN